MSQNSFQWSPAHDLTNPQTQTSTHALDRHGPEVQAQNIICEHGQQT